MESIAIESQSIAGILTPVDGARQIAFRAYTVDVGENRSPDYQEIIMTNEPPPPLQNVSITETAGDLNVTFDWTSLDSIGVEIHMSTVSAYFEPDATTLLQRDATGSSDITVASAIPGPGTYYVRVGAFDNWGVDGIYFSPSTTITAVAAMAMILAEDGAQELANRQVRDELQMLRRELARLREVVGV